MDETNKTKRTMEPQEFFHDHPVIDERPDGTVRMYFHDLPPLLLKDPIRYPPPPDDEDKTTD